MKTLIKIISNIKQNIPLFLLIAGAVVYSSCGSSTAETTAPPPQELPVVSVAVKPITTYSEFTASATRQQGY
jgi:membrane fusion protein (multidrug efflux system)